MFGRVITAMVTPFDENDNLSISGVKKLVNHLISNGTDTILLSGTTGEGPTLNNFEKFQLLKETRKVAPDTKIIMNAGSNNTMETINFVKEIEGMNIADGLLIVNPYYNKPSQEGLYRHFEAIANATELPVILYNIPSRTSVNLEVATVKRLSQIKNIIGIKESTGDLAQMTKIVKETPKTFHLYSGDDNMTLPALSVGAKGVVSVASHIVGNEIQEMISAFEKGDNEQAMKCNQSLSNVFEDIFFRTNPVPVKNMLDFLGINVGGVRLPLVDLNAEDKLNLALMMIKDLPYNSGIKQEEILRKKA